MDVVDIQRSQYMSLQSSVPRSHREQKSSPRQPSFAHVPPAPPSARSTSWTLNQTSISSSQPVARISQCSGPRPLNVCQSLHISKLLSSISDIHIASAAKAAPGCATNSGVLQIMERVQLVRDRSFQMGGCPRAQDMGPDRILTTLQSSQYQSPD